MSSSKRASTLPKPPTSFSANISISDNASLVGTKLITVREQSIIHPRAIITSMHGPVIIGSTCIISERANIGLQSPAISQPEGVVLEDTVVVEVGSVVEAAKVGNGTVIEVGAIIGKGAVIGKHCKIGPLCRVQENETIPDYTIIYGQGLRRIDKSDVDVMKTKLVGRQAEMLRKLVVGNLTKWQ